MIKETQRLTRRYFADNEGAEAFHLAFTRLLAMTRKVIVSQYLPAENMQRFQHGGDLQHPGAPQTVRSGMQVLTASAATDYDDIIENRLDAIGKCVWQLAEAMHGHFATTLYSTVSAACEQTGNVIDAQGSSSLADSFLAMLEKIEFVADKHGNVNMPTIHASPETAQRMLDEANSASPEFKERVEAIQETKIAEAKAREAERKAKFTKYGDD